MTDQDGSGPTLVQLTAEQARDTVAAAAQQYFESRRGRVDAFVDRHFSVAGALALHRKALGWDVLRVPTNILLAIPNIALQLSALGAQATGARSGGPLPPVARWMRAPAVSIWRVAKRGR